MKILLFDIENSPCLAYTWGLYSEITSTKFIVQDWYILCYSAKWFGSKEIISDSLNYYEDYKPYVGDDYHVVSTLWDLLDQADVVVAHNAVQFDVKKANARFIKHGFNPPSPYKIVDTLKIARRYFKFTSNRLGDLGEHLGLGSKEETGGFDLWKQCMAGDEKAWLKMNKYCKKDVVLLDKIYKKFRPYIKNHPNYNVYNDVDTNCPKCGSKSLNKRGFTFLTTGKKQRYQCNKCGGWCSDGRVIKNA